MILFLNSNYNLSSTFYLQDGAKHLTFWEIRGSFHFKLSIYYRGDKLLPEVYQDVAKHSSRPASKKTRGMEAENRNITR